MQSLYKKATAEHHDLNLQLNYSIVVNQVSNSSFDFNSNDNNGILGISTINLNTISDKMENVIGRTDFGKRKIENKSGEKNDWQNS